MAQRKQPLVWLVTGASSGLGRHLVQSILARGDRVIASARNVDKLKDFVEVENVRVLPLDLDAGAIAVKARIEEGLAFWGYIDVLVNNAGTSMKSFVEEAGSDLFRKQFQTNFFGLLDTTVAVLPSMRERRTGTIVMIGSRSSWRGEIPCTGMYAASIAAVRTISETLASELAEFSIRVLIVEPAGFRTEGILKQPFNDSNTIADYDNLRSHVKDVYTEAEHEFHADPVKGMEDLVDVVKGEGKAAGRAWPLYLPMGDGAERDIRAKCKKMTDICDNYVDLIRGLDIEN